MLTQVFKQRRLKIEEIINEDNQLNDLNVNVNLGEQFDSHQLFNLDQAFLAQFDQPFITKQLKQIQSTFISKVACGVEHALLLTSSGFVYSMGFDSCG